MVVCALQKWRSCRNKKGEKVVICFLAGKNVDGWLAVAESVAKLVVVAVRENHPHRPVGVACGANLEATSVAEVLREVEKVPVGVCHEKKLVSISFAFIGAENQWKKITENLEAARLWSQSCEKMEGISVLKEDEDILMEVEINDDLPAKVTPAARVVVAPERREEEQGTVGDV